MIDFLSNWAKSLGLAIVVISILEMLLPNNKIKKYIRMVFGVYVMFCIMSPFFKNNTIFKKSNVEEYIESYSKSAEVNQTSMDKKINELYIEQMEKDITKKLEDRGYIVDKCQVDATITNDVNTTKINKIKLTVEADENKVEQKEDFENVLVSEVQKIKKIDTNITNDENEDNDKTLSTSQVNEIKNLLKEEYGVNEKCLVIN